MKEIADRLVKWIAEHVEGAGARGTVVGVSGGVDSAAVLALCARATPGRVTGVIMPCHSAAQDLEDAELVIRTVGVESLIVDLTPVFDRFVETLGESAMLGDLAQANIRPRLRMITLYHVAARRKSLVVGTGNRAEMHVGYFTKHGDGGVDLLPLGGLVKEEVRRLASYLGIPDRIVNRVPSAGLWPGQTDEGEMGLTYKEIDEYLLTGDAKPRVQQMIDSMHRLSEHKRRMPPVPVL
ncbi:MAG: NAD(+) synthase [Bacillota bacterium]